MRVVSLDGNTCSGVTQRQRELDTLLHWNSPSHLGSGLVLLPQWMGELFSELFCYISNKMRPKENLHPLLVVGEKL